MTESPDASASNAPGERKPEFIGDVLVQPGHYLSGKRNQSLHGGVYRFPEACV